MHSVTVKKDMNLSAERIWPIIDDFGGVHKYHPLVHHSPVITGNATGLGAERVCHFEDGNSVNERIVQYRPGQGYTVELVAMGKFPLRKALGHMDVESLGAGKSRVTFRMEFEPKFGPLGWLMARLIMIGQFRKVLGSVLDGVEKLARSQPPTAGDSAGANVGALRAVR